MATPPRPDGKFIVPAVALNSETTNFNIAFHIRETLPITYVRGERQFASWWGKNPLDIRTNWKAEADFTPDRAAHFITEVNDARQIYQKGLLGREMNISRLSQIMGNFLSGGWYRHQVEKLPYEIKTNPESAQTEVRDIFAGFENRMTLNQRAYDTLDEEGKFLLHHGFKFLIQATLSPLPIYFDLEISQILEGTVNATGDYDIRNPHEDSAQPQGITPDQVKAVYFPDQVGGLSAERIALTKLEQLGIPQNLVHRVSDLAIQPDIILLNSCADKYHKFTGQHLIQAIHQGSFVHIFEYFDV